MSSFLPHRVVQKKWLIRISKSAILLILMVSILVNISFIMETRNGLEVDTDKIAGNYGQDNRSVIESARPLHTLHAQITSSRQLVSLKLNDKTVYLSDGFDEERGIHVIVLNQASAGIMALRVFDTYSVNEDKAFVQFITSVSVGRILVFAIKDEGTFQLQDAAKLLLTGLGSELVQSLHWRDMWAFVCIKGKGKLAEGHSVSADLSVWGDPVTVTTTVDLVSKTESRCKLWPDSETTDRRRKFCEKYEGYGPVCSCENPESLHFSSQPLENGELLNVPVAVIASNRPRYLFRMLKTLLQSPGASKDMVTVFIDGHYDEPLDVTRLLDLRGIQHTPLGQKNSRISQHYKASISTTFSLFPDARYVILVEEDLDVSPDFFNYFRQTMSLLDIDETLYCISAWNDQGYSYSCEDPALLYRVETMPGLGWMMKKSLFVEELEPQWPSPDKLWDWDMWMRHDMIRKSRECVIPDISRTYHFGSTGLNVNPYFQEIYFQSHKLQSKPNVRLRDIDRMVSEKYEVLVKDLIQRAKVLDHSKDPCSEDFIPNTEDEVFVLYIQMKTESDFETWKHLAKCYKLWDLDVRGFHKSMWRQFLHGKHIIMVGVPASPYSEFKPPEVTPVYLEEQKQKQEN